MVGLSPLHLDGAVGGLVDQPRHLVAVLHTFLEQDAHPRSASAGAAVRTRSSRSRRACRRPSARSGSRQPIGAGREPVAGPEGHVGRCAPAKTSSRPARRTRNATGRIGSNAARAATPLRTPAVPAHRPRTVAGGIWHGGHRCEHAGRRPASTVMPLNASTRAGRHEQVTGLDLVSLTTALLAEPIA